MATTDMTSYSSTWTLNELYDEDKPIVGEEEPRLAIAIFPLPSWFGKDNDYYPSMETIEEEDEEEEE